MNEPASPRIGEQRIESLVERTLNAYNIERMRNRTPKFLILGQAELAGLKAEIRQLGLIAKYEDEGGLVSFMGMRIVACEQQTNLFGLGFDDA